MFCSRGRLRGRGGSEVTANAFVKDLVSAGMPEAQAERIARYNADTIGANLLTKQCLEAFCKRLLLKLGAMIVIGYIAFIAVILGLVPRMVG